MPPTSARAVAEMLEILSHQIRLRGYSGGLNPAQWAALRYVAQAGSGDATVSGFARAHRSTQGTAAQTVAALVRKGFLERQPMPNDRRAAVLGVTPAGRRKLEEDPLEEVVAAVRLLAAARRAELARAVAALIAAFPERLRVLPR
jgi:DNA-binding MarR family transcriptional regulator